MTREYVERRNASFYVTGSRVPLAHIVREFDNGEPPEAIRMHYPALTLEQVYGAITFYLANRQEVRKDIAEREREEAEFTRTHPAPPEIQEKFHRMRGKCSRGEPRKRVRLMSAALPDPREMPWPSLAQG